MKKLLALALTLALTLSAAPALAAGEKFPATKPYPGFSDVPAGAWYEQNVKTCAETGLMQGTGNGFAPDKTMQVAEVAAIAARIGEILTGKAIPHADPKVGESLPWYLNAVAYMNNLATAQKNDVLRSRLAQPTESAARGDFIGLLALVLPETELTPKNSVASLPDSKDKAVLAFYNAGILQGIGDYGFFQPAKTLTRAEAAAMVARVVRPAERLSFTLKPADPYTLASGLAPNTPFFTAKGQAITSGDYLPHLVATLDSLAQSAAQQGLEFHWDLTVNGDVPLKDFAAQAALIDAAAMLLQRNYAAKHKIAADLSDAAFTQAAVADLMRKDNPTADGFLAAKHILIRDKAAAEAVLATLKADPSQFDKLMNEKSEDGRSADGKLGAPNGYLFSAGDMVPEFEAGTRALSIGAMSGLVESQHGYHIILRTDPRDEAYASSLLNAALTAELKTYGDFLPTPAFKAFDPQVFYSKLTDQRSGTGK
ncbi:MAG: S-layer homology domain-containing protein [Pseudoflavonifractor sp.]